MYRFHQPVTHLPVRSKPRRSQGFFRSSCSVCGLVFKSYSHFDAICDVCWADNEMRPYATSPRSGRKVGISH